MQFIRWRYALVILKTAGVCVLCAGLSKSSAQSRFSNVETPSSRVKASSPLKGDFAPGGGVRIKVWRDLGLSDQGGIQNLGLNDDFIIDSKGVIRLPIIGEISAAGQSRSDLAQTIKSRLEPFIGAKVVICAPLIRLTLTGAVNRPGSYLIEPKASLWELIDEANGPSNNADLRKIFVQRGGKKVTGNLLERFEQGHSLEEIGVQSGDQIVVPGASGVSFRTVVDYVTLTASVALVYLQISDRTTR